MQRGGLIGDDEAQKLSALAHDLVREREGLEPGRRLGEFRLLRELGRGGMGIVFEAVQEPLERHVALKVLSGGATLDERLVRRFLAEAKAAASLEHPHLVRVLTSGRSEGVLYHAMELIEGGSVEDEIRSGPLEVDRALQLTIETARALHHVHEAGLIHRDVKPGNILIDRKGRGRLTDFGLVLDLGNAERTTLTHQLLGTPAYMAPEQVRGGETDIRTDIHGLGATLQAMLTGRPPVRGEHAGEVLARLLEDRRETLGRLRPELPAELIATCESTQARNPAVRPASALALAERLESLRDGKSIDLSGSGRPPARRRWLALGLLAMGLVVAGMVATDRLPSSEDAPSPGLPVPEAHWVRRADWFELAVDTPHPKRLVRLSGDGEWLGWSHRPQESDAHVVMVENRHAGGRMQLPISSGIAFHPDGQELVTAARPSFHRHRMEALRRDDLTPTLADWPRPSHLVLQAWSPDGGRLAMTSGAQGTIFSARPRTAAIFDIETHDYVWLPVDDVSELAWSPSGNRLVFRRQERLHTDLWTVSPDGSATRRLTDDDAIETSPQWLSPGDRILYGREHAGRAQLWSRPVDPETGEPRGPGEALVHLPVLRGISLSVGDEERLAALTPYTSSRIAYRLQLDVTGTEVLDVSAPQPLTVSVDELSISPSGEVLALVLENGTLGLQRFSSDGPAEWSLLDEELTSVRRVAWCPTGGRLSMITETRASEDDATTESALWWSNSTGDELHRLVTGSRLNGPCWSPDGRRIAVVVDDELQLVDVVTGDIQRQRLDRPFHPSSWSPEGDRLAGWNEEGLLVHDLRIGTSGSVLAPGTNPTWLPDGRRLLHVRDGAVHVLLTDTGESGLLFAPQPAMVTSSLSLTTEGTVVHCILEVLSEQVWLLDLEAVLADDDRGTSVRG
ncbi:MAG: WD40 repeat domain-containing serine/threonine protein kinase [Acidobacteriota bacterium]